MDGLLTCEWIVIKEWHCSRRRLGAREDGWMNGAMWVMKMMMLLWIMHRKSVLLTSRDAGAADAYTHRSLCDIYCL